MKLLSPVRHAVSRFLAGHPALVRRTMLAAGLSRSPVRPEIVQIESTNICNAKCVFCPRDDMHRKQGVMDVPLFQKIVDECVRLGIRHIRLHNYGESFIDRHLVEKIRYAKAAGVPNVGLISNGSLIDEKAARGIIDAGLDAINISLDAAGAESFERTRIGLKYRRVVENIERLVQLRKDAGRRRPKLILSFVRQGNNAEEEAFIARWSAVADKVHVTDLHNWAGVLHRKSDVKYPCYRPWLTFTILWDGRVSLCCADLDGQTILGDVRTSTIEAIWNGDTFRAVRRSHLESGGPTLCQSCDLPKKDSPLWVRGLIPLRRQAPGDRVEP